jgi:hypothetical protein
MKNAAALFALAFAFSTATVATAAPENVGLKSPDGRIAVELQIDSGQPK